MNSVKKVFDKFSDAFTEQEIDIINVENGHDFHLIVKNQVTGTEEYANYDSSMFATKQTPICDVSKMDEVYDAIMNLKEKIIGKGPQTYEKLEALMSGKKSEVENAESDNVQVSTIDTQAEIKEVAKVDTKINSSTTDDDDFNFDFDDSDKK